MLPFGACGFWRVQAGTLNEGIVTMQEPLMQCG
jgi:hypothetical protein